MSWTRTCALTMVIYIPEIYIMLIVWRSAHCQGCDAGWFGDDCSLLCHCLKSKTCDNQGRCPNDEPCLRGYFGLGCQYVDVLRLTSLSDADEFIRDGDENCNPEPDAEFIAIPLPVPITFTWFRLVLRDNEYLFNFNTTLGGSIPCTHERKFKVSDAVVDVTCDRVADIMAIQIKGPAAGSICSIYVSGGRNVALKQKAEQSSAFTSQPEISSGAQNAVDGSRSTRFSRGHCATVDSMPSPPWWQLMFLQPQILYRVIIYNRFAFRERLSQFTVETFDDYNTQTSVYNVSSSEGLEKYEINISTLIPISILKVTSTRVAENESDRVMTICELIAFGDPVCPQGTYGFKCEKTCHCKSTEICQQFSGACTTACRAGLYGPDCLSHCGQNCVHGLCTFRSGKCLACTPGHTGDRCEHVCTPGRFGSGCRFNCSDGCLDVCDTGTGSCICDEGYSGLMCTECSPALYGSNCDLNCSDVCGDKGCDRLTGDCLACKGNRAPPLCQDCQRMFFGPQCAFKCSKYCLNRTCDGTSGDCLGCEKGYEGPQCHKIPVHFTEWLFMVPLFLLNLLLVLLCVYRRKPTHTLSNPELYSHGL